MVLSPNKNPKRTVKFRSIFRLLLDYVNSEINKKKWKNAVLGIFVFGTQSESYFSKITAITRLEVQSSATKLFVIAAKNQVLEPLQLKFYLPRKSLTKDIKRLTVTKSKVL